MTQVFLTKASTSPWATPSNMDVNTTTGQTNVTTAAQSAANYFFIGNAVGNEGLWQSFTSNWTGLIDTLMLVVAKAGNPADNLLVTIVDNSGATLASATAFPASQVGINGVGQNVTFKFTPVSVTNGSTYGFKLFRSNTTIDATNYWRPIGNASSTYTGGTLQGFTSSSSTWTPRGAGNEMSFVVGYHIHTTEIMGHGGNGGAGTAGTTGSGGGGAAGGNYTHLVYLGGSGAIVPGTTTIGFLIQGGGGSSATLWQNTTGTNVWYGGSGGSGTNTGLAGAAGTGNKVGTPPIPYTCYWGWLAGQGGVTGTNLGGGGGAGAGGPDSGNNLSNTAQTGTGGSGGGGGNRGGGAPAQATTGTFTSGGQGMFGSPGASSGASGTGNSGGAGSTATTTTGSTAGSGGGTSTEFDASHGCGGGGGGAGAATSTGTYTITGGNGANYGGGGGGCGYGRGTATFVPGVGGDGLIAIFYDVPPVGAAAPGSTLLMMGVG
jgi:hypothetical protein